MSRGSKQGNSRVRAPGIVPCSAVSEGSRGPPYITRAFSLFFFLHFAPSKESLSQHTHREPRALSHRCGESPRRRRAHQPAHTHWKAPVSNPSGPCAGSSSRLPRPLCWGHRAGIGPLCTPVALVNQTRRHERTSGRGHPLLIDIVMRLPARAFSKRACLVTQWGSLSDGAVSYFFPIFTRLCAVSIVRWSVGEMNYGEYLVLAFLFDHPSSERMMLQCFIEFLQGVYLV